MKKNPYNDIGKILIFGNGKRCLVAKNSISKGKWIDGEYKSFDDSKLVLVDIDSGEVVLHYSGDYIPRDNGEYYIPLWGSVTHIKNSVNELKYK